eukprot:13091802-Alexandrium_andersonii.AAC.1
MIQSHSITPKGSPFLLSGAGDTQKLHIAHMIPLVCALDVARRALMTATPSLHLYLGWTDQQCVAVDI